MTDQIVNQIREVISSGLTDQERLIWFNDLKISVQDDTIVLSTDSSFKQELIEDCLQKRLRNVLKNTFNYRKIVPKLVSDEGNEISANSSLRISAKDGITSQNAPYHFPTNIPQVLKENNFSRYVITEENQLAFKFAQKSILNLGDINPIYIYGQIGTGKTHLLHAVYQELKEKHPYLAIQYIQPDDFVGEYTQALQLKQDRQFRTKYRSLDVLLIDDIQFLAGKEKSSQEFFHIFSSIQTPGKQMIFCSDRTPRELGDLAERIKSRLASSVILELKQPGYHSKLKIIEFYLHERKLDLDREIITFLAESLPDDIRQIVGAVKHLTLIHQFEDENIQSMPITLDFCRKNLRQLQLHRPVQGNYQAEDLLKAYCKKTEIMVTDLQSPKRHKRISEHRQMVMYLLKTYTNLSLQEIGNLMGSKSAASVHQNHNKIEMEIKQDQSKAKFIETLLKEV